MSALRVASPEEVQRRRDRDARWAWVKREAHWLCLGAVIVLGGCAWGWLAVARPWLAVGAALGLALGLLAYVALRSFEALR